MKPVLFTLIVVDRDARPVAVNIHFYSSRNAARYAYKRASAGNTWAWLYRGMPIMTNSPVMMLQGAHIIQALKKKKLSWLGRAFMKFRVWL